MYMINRKKLILISGGKKHKKEPWYDVLGDAVGSLGAGYLNSFSVVNGGNNNENNQWKRIK